MSLRDAYLEGSDVLSSKPPKKPKKSATVAVTRLPGAVTPPVSKVEEASLPEEIPIPEEAFAEGSAEGAAAAEAAATADEEMEAAVQAALSDAGASEDELEAGTGGGGAGVPPAAVTPDEATAATAAAAETAALDSAVAAATGAPTDTTAVTEPAPVAPGEGSGDSYVDEYGGTALTAEGLAAYRAWKDAQEQAAERARRSVAEPGAPTTFQVSRVSVAPTTQVRLTVPTPTTAVTRAVAPAPMISQLAPAPAMVTAVPIAAPAPATVTRVVTQAPAQQVMTQVAPTPTQVVARTAPAPVQQVTARSAPAQVQQAAPRPTAQAQITRPATPAVPTMTMRRRQGVRVSGEVLAFTLSSPLSGVADEAWTRFVVAVRGDTPVGAVSPSNALGMFQMKPRRLADLDLVMNLSCTRSPNGRMIWVGEFVPPLTAKKFLNDPALQYRTFSMSMKKYVDDLRSRAISKPDGGRPDDMSLSGVLAILHRCGPSGLKTWNNEAHFEETTDLYERTNRIF